MIDSIIKKGVFHRSMPQDYAVAVDIGTTKHPLPFIAIADGCSAGQHSELGAMILTRAALAVAKYYRDRLGLEYLGTGVAIQNSMLEDVKHRASQVAQELKLELDDMIATLRVAFVYENILYTIETGDGYNFFIHNDGKFIAHQHEYEINAPFYLAYDMFDKIKEYDGIGVNLLDTLYTNNTQDPALVLPSHTRFSQQISLDSIPTIDYFGLATDGIASYMMNDGSNLAVKPEAIVGQLAQIKQPAGEFLVRRFQKMDKELTEKGFVNQDDVGVAMINLLCYRATREANK